MIYSYSSKVTWESRHDVEGWWFIYALCFMIFVPSLARIFVWTVCLIQGQKEWLHPTTEITLGSWPDEGWCPASCYIYAHNFGFFFPSLDQLLLGYTISFIPCRLIGFRMFTFRDNILTACSMKCSDSTNFQNGKQKQTRIWQKKKSGSIRESWYSSTKT
jgi:hypothetical protein